MSDAETKILRRLKKLEKKQSEILNNLKSLTDLFQNFAGNIDTSHLNLIPNPIISYPPIPRPIILLNNNKTIRPQIISSHIRTYVLENACKFQDYQIQPVEAGLKYFCK